ncbi:MAG: hypothetical protein COB17_10300 [Sulfurimonas sp.]|nr:MAG: hypothetical protein COB17_10300 [Sulfurimonas sp.]
MIFGKKEVDKINKAVKKDFIQKDINKVDEKIKKIKSFVAEDIISKLDSFEIGIITNTKKGNFSYVTDRKMSIFIKDVNLTEQTFDFINKNDRIFNHKSVVLYKHNTKRFIEEIIILSNNEVSLKSIIFFFNKYKNQNIKLFNTKQMNYFIKQFINKKIHESLNTDAFINLFIHYNSNDIIEIIDSYVSTTVTLDSKVINLLLTKINEETVQSLFKSENKDKFFNVSSINEKVASLPSVVKSKYSDLINSFNKCKNYNHVNVSFDANTIYDQFKDSDYTLAKKWINNNNHDVFEYAKMLSARGAELASIKFYEQLCSKVYDTAITQINNDSSDWKLFDLVVDNKNIDVKNSRSVFNEKLSYSEHCIPRFKKTRTSNPVNILGVISPYIKLEENQEQLERKTFYSTTNIENMITVLGETSLNEIDSYANRFSKKGLEVDLDKKNFTPDWILEYPKEFYKYRDELKSDFIKTFNGYPSAIEYDVLNENLIPFFLSCGIDLPNIHDENIFYGRLTKEQFNFYNRLKIQGKQTITKPFLYLAILKHFSERLQKSKDINYTPSDYKKLIYYEESFNYPLGIYDPTFIIKKLIDTLETLWQQRNVINMSSYVTFKYNQKGILLAKISMSTSWDTLIAYCGGFIEGKGACGFKPLIKGKHKTCSYCKKIICPKCNFCINQCVRLKK